MSKKIDWDKPVITPRMLVIWLIVYMVVLILDIIRMELF